MNYSLFGFIFRPRFWPTLFTTILFVCLCLLGNWQVERLDWKLGLIDQLTTRVNQQPVTLPDGEIDPEELEYLSVEVTGKFLNDKEMTLYSIGPNGEAGYDLYTPLELDNGRGIIINRGWVPERLKTQSLRPDSLPNGMITVEGLLRKPWCKLWYGPENDPAQNNWFYGDVNAMANTALLDDYFSMYLFAAKKQGEIGLPIAGRTELNIVNNHLDYALTWYGLAIVLLGIYFLTHIKKKPSE
jgi:surfeit locus 1 family protein